MTTLKVKTATGSITEMRVAELLEIDGKPYRPEISSEAIRDAVIHLEGRVEAIETILSGKG